QSEARNVRPPRQVARRGGRPAHIVANFDARTHRPRALPLRPACRPRRRLPRLQQHRVRRVGRGQVRLDDGDRPVCVARLSRTRTARRRRRGVGGVRLRNRLPVRRRDAASRRPARLRHPRVRRVHHRRRRGGGAALRWKARGARRAHVLPVRGDAALGAGPVARLPDRDRARVHAHLPGPPRRRHASGLLLHLAAPQAAVAAALLLLAAAAGRAPQRRSRRVAPPSAGTRRSREGAASRQLLARLFRQVDAGRRARDDLPPRPAFGTEARLCRQDTSHDASGTWPHRSPQHQRALVDRRCVEQRARAAASAVQRTLRRPRAAARLARLRQRRRRPRRRRERRQLHAAVRGSGGAAVGDAALAGGGL
ncbi:hypothetical protein EMIHUDRAFT_452310, partial [Emiliania huxleyi CCMP1516]|uniref:Uncharacterized protein n=2 Tax=Emiliania huxleyi TaxID=2903 RepID=A0A0D3IKP4_EMIH1